MWDAESYLRYESERARPFFDLVAAVDHPHPRAVADLGCGPGGLTATLLGRWPEAVIWGVDNSEEMITHARRRAIIDRLRFEISSVADWRAPGPVDVMVSNACFQWIPDHRHLLDHLLPQLAGGGVLGFQVPNNFNEASHAIPWELMNEGGWRGRFDVLERGAVESPEWYLEELGRRGLSASAWEMTYYHVLEGDDPIVDWLAGTTLRPVLSVLDENDQQEFLSELAGRLAEAYPKRSIGTVFPFRRIFVVAKAPN